MTGTGVLFVIWEKEGAGDRWMAMACAFVALNGTDWLSAWVVAAQ